MERPAGARDRRFRADHLRHSQRRDAGSRVRRARSDLPTDQLPVDDLGDVSENCAGLEFVDEREGIAPHASVDLTVSLAPSRYVLLCNLPTHYAQGMVTSFEIVGEPSPSPSSTTPEQNIVPAAVVANGLRDMTNAIRSGKPADELYTLWYGFDVLPVCMALDAPTWIPDALV